MTAYADVHAAGLPDHVLVDHRRTAYGRILPMTGPGRGRHSRIIPKLAEGDDGFVANSLEIVASAARWSVRPDDAPGSSCGYPDQLSPDCHTFAHRSPPQPASVEVGKGATVTVADVLKLARSAGDVYEVGVHPSPVRRAPLEGHRPATVVTLSGEADMAVAGPLRRHLDAAIEGGADVVLDLSHVTLIDCSCLGVLMQARQQARSEQRICVAAPAPLVKRVFHVTGLDKHFPVYASTRDALQSLPCGQTQTEAPEH